MRLDRVRASLTEVEVDGEVAVYHPDSDSVVLLNPSASEIWRLTAGGPTTLEELVPAVAATFGIDEVEARSGVEAGIALLVAERLLTTAPDGLGG